MTQSDRQTARGTSLAGVKVLDLSRVLAAPLAAQILGDLGAEVVKIERPGTGDDSRNIGGVALDGHDGPTSERSFFLSCNRNKQSLTLDLANPAAQDVLKRLAASADVLIENYKVGTLDKYGLDYDSLAALNPRLIYCSVTGYGQDGPRAPEPGYDPVFQAESGIMSITGFPDREPVKAGTYLVDILGGHNAAIGILAALNDRANSGLGQHVDIALFDCALASLATVGQSYLVSGHVPGRQGNGPLSGGPSDVFNCSDGSVYIIAGLDRQFQKLCAVLKLEHLPSEPKFAKTALRYTHRAELREILQQAIQTWQCAPLLAELSAVTVPAGRVNTIEEALSDDQAVFRHMVRPMAHPLSDDLKVLASPIRLSRTPPVYDQPPPLLGEHSDSVLNRWLGMSANDVDALRGNGAI